MLTTPRHAAGMSLLSRVGACVLAVPLEHVRETMRPLLVEPLANAPSFVMGLAVIRGAAVPVVQTAALLGARDAAQPTRFVLLATGDRHVALAVGSVIGIRRLDTAEQEELPPLLREANPGMVSAIGRLDADLLVVLRAACIIPETMWQALDAGGRQP